MIIKTKTHKTKHSPNFKRIIAYLEKGAKENEKETSLFPLLDNLKEGNSKLLSKQFFGHFRRMQAIKKQKVHLYHEIINFGDIDVKKIDAEMLYGFAREYIAKRTENRPALCYCQLHWKKGGFPHLHFLFSARDVLGRNMRQSKSEFVQIRKDMEELALAKFSKLVAERVYTKETSLKRSKGKQLIPEKIQELVQKSLKGSKDFEDFIKKAQQQELILYHYRQKPAGLIYVGKKYRWRRLGVDIQQWKEKDLGQEMSL